MKPPAFQWYAKEWISDERRFEMSLSQRGAFIDLLSYQWHNGRIPPALPAIARILSVTEPEAKAVMAGALEAAFPGDGNGGLANARLESYRKELQELSKKKSEAARSAAAKRWHSDGNAPALQTDMPTQSPTSTPAPAPASNNNKNSSSTLSASQNRNSEHPDFATFWAAYPKRSGGNPRAGAAQAYAARRRAGVSAEVLLAAVQRYAAWCRATDNLGTEKVKQARFWLAPNYEGWEQPWDVPVRGDDDTPAFPDYPIPFDP